MQLDPIQIFDMNHFDKKLFWFWFLLNCVETHIQLKLAQPGKSTIELDLMTKSEGEIFNIFFIIQLHRNASLLNSYQHLRFR